MPAKTSSTKNAYLVLGLHKGASMEEIKQAYLKLVKKFDPEKHTDRFMVIDKAFQRLKVPTSRAKEDLTTFNFVRGEYQFNPEERTDRPDAQIDQALQMLERKIGSGEMSGEQANPKLMQGLMMRSGKKIQKKQWEEAIADWQKILTIDPTHRRAKHNLLFCYQSLGYQYASHDLYEEAIEVWSKAARMDPDNEGMLHNLALACERAEQHEDARRYWQEVIKRWKARLSREPDNEYLKTLVIEVLRERGEGEPLPPELRATAEKASATPEPREAPAQRTASIADLREILRLNPNDFEAQFKIANILMKEASRAPQGDQRRWEAVVKELSEMMRKYPRNVEVLDMLGTALLNSGKMDQAFTVWKKALSIEPKNYQVTESLIRAHMSMGRMLRDKGLYTPSLVQFKALTRYLPDSDEVHYEIAKTYQAMGNEAAAYKEFNEALRLNPKHKLARNGLSSLKLRR